MIIIALLLSILPYLGSSLIHAAILLQSPYSPFGTNPNNTAITARGHNSTLVYRFNLSSSGAAESLSKLVIHNSGTNVRFGNGITAVRLYEDAKPNGSGDNELNVTEDTEIKALTSFSSNSDPTQNIILSTPITISSADIKTFFIAYDISPHAAIGASATTNLKITGINSSTITNIETSIIQLSGIETVNIQSIAPNVVIPGQEKVPMLSFSIKLNGDAANLTADTERVILSFANSANSFATGNTQAGITKAHLYKLPSGFSVSDIIQLNSPLITVTNTGINGDPKKFRTTQFLDFKFTPANFTSLVNDFKDSVTVNFFVAYDIGIDTVVTENTYIGIQLDAMSILGNAGSLAMKWPSSAAAKADETTTQIGGLSLVSIENAVPVGSTFGPNTKAPILKFKLRANHTTVTINNVTLLNPGTVKYIVKNSDSNGINRVRLFYDKDGDNAFSEFSDEVISNVQLGITNPVNNIKNQKDTVVMPVTNNGLVVNEFNKNAIGYPNNNDKVFFVMYHFGESITGSDNGSGLVTKEATAQLGKTTSSTNLTIANTVSQVQVSLSKVSNTSPAIASPSATINLGDTNVTIIDAVDISLPTVLRGQIKAPMLKLILNASSDLTSTNLQIKNDKLTFTSNSKGIDKVWVYRDVNENNQFDSNDVFLNASQGYTSDSIVDITGIPLNRGNNHLLILYDIGQQTILNSDIIRAQLNNVTSIAGTIILGGQIPIPAIAASSQVIDSYISSVSLAGISIGTNAAITANIKISATNQHTQPLTISRIFPKMYKNAISGADMSFEFATNPTSNALSAGANSTFSSNFDIKHAIATSGGEAYIDAYIEYQITPTHSARVQRYFDGTSWQSAVSTVPVLTLFKTVENNPWITPGYIKQLSYIRGGTKFPFQNQMALRASDKLEITFHNDGTLIDESSLTLSLNNTALIRTFDGKDNTYSYNSTTGTLTVPYIGNSDGALSLTVKDTQGNLLDTTSLTFSISNTIRIERPLFHPNPYQMGSQDLQVGFNLTQAATVSVYFFNALGQLVYTQEESFSDTGYHKMTFNQNSSFLSPGVYIIKLIATNSNGEKDIQSTSLGIH